MTPGARGTRRENDGGVRTGNQKIHSLTNMFFSGIDPYLQIFDEYFSTFFRLFDNLFMMIREFDSNYEILDDNWRF